MRHPQKVGSYVLAIEADGASYHSGHTARERDRLRQSLLEKRGWIFHRIWSTDWFDDPDAEVQKVMRSYELALQARDGLYPKEKLDDEGDRISAEPGWHIEAAFRTIPRPAYESGMDSLKHLCQIIRHIRSDGVLVTRDDELLIVLDEAGYKQKGSRIVELITMAQDQVDKEIPV